MPESMHMIMWAMSDRTLPRSLRMIEGFGVHSFRLVNAAGDSTFVKFHWRPKLGLQSTIWDEAVKIAGADPDFHRRDMFEAIESGGFPEWEFAVQLFTEEDAASFPFDHLDPTKLIPEELVPLKVIGRMVLDRWPTTFAETEQVAFARRICAGDRLLQRSAAPGAALLVPRHPVVAARLAQLPPAAVTHRSARSPTSARRYMQMAVPKGRVNYEPSSLAPFGARDAGGAAALSSRIGQRAHRAETRRPLQPGRLFFRSQTAPEQAHLASALVFEPSKVETPHIREAMVGHLLNVDPISVGASPTGSRRFAAPPGQQRRPRHGGLASAKLIGKMMTRRGPRGRDPGGRRPDGTVVATLKKAALDAGASESSRPRSGRYRRRPRLPPTGSSPARPRCCSTRSRSSSTRARPPCRRRARRSTSCDAFGHLKAIVSTGGQALLQAGVARTRVVNAHAACLHRRARTAWSREPEVRTLPGGGELACDNRSKGDDAAKGPRLAAEMQQQRGALGAFRLAFGAARRVAAASRPIRT
jgi:catalase